MKYSFFFKWFKVLVRIKNRAEFKFILNGSYVWWSKYKIVICNNFEENNIFTTKINYAKERRKIFQSKWSKSLGIIQPELSFLIQKSSDSSTNTINDCKDIGKGEKQLRFSQILSSVKSTKSLGIKSQIKHPWVAAYNANPHNSISKFKKEVVKAITSSKTKSLIKSSNFNDLKSFRSPQKHLEPLFDMATSVMRNPNNIGDAFDKEFFFSEIGLKLEDSMEEQKINDKSWNIDKLTGKSIYKLKFLLKSSNNYSKGAIKLLKSISTSSVSEESNHDIFKLISSGYLISKSKSKPSEDAFFIHDKAVGVADGVGGWARFGVDWSKFANEIMNRWRKYWERMGKFEKYTSDVFLSNKFIENCEEIYNTISKETRRKKLHSNSFWLNQQGQSGELSYSNDQKF